MAGDRFGRRVGLRLRIAGVAVLAVGVAVTIGAVVLVVLLRSRLDTAATTAATLRARDIAALAEADTLPGQLALPGEESAFVQVVDARDSVVASTGNIDGRHPTSPRGPAALSDDCDPAARRGGDACGRAERRHQRRCCHGVCG